MSIIIPDTNRSKETLQPFSYWQPEENPIKFPINTIKLIRKTVTNSENSITNNVISKSMENVLPKELQAWRTRSGDQWKWRGSSSNWFQNSDVIGNDFSPTKVPMIYSAVSWGIRGVDGTEPIWLIDWLIDRNLEGSKCKLLVMHCKRKREEWTYELWVWTRSEKGGENWERLINYVKTTELRRKRGECLEVRYYSMSPRVPLKMHR